jgi:hypothetical protein
MYENYRNVLQDTTNSYYNVSNIHQLQQPIQYNNIEHMYQQPASGGQLYNLTNPLKSDTNNIINNNQFNQYFNIQTDFTFTSNNTHTSSFMPYNNSHLQYSTGGFNEFQNYYQQPQHHNYQPANLHYTKPE